MSNLLEIFCPCDKKMILIGGQEHYEAKCYLCRKIKKAKYKCCQCETTLCGKCEIDQQNLFNYAKEMSEQYSPSRSLSYLSSTTETKRAATVPLLKTYGTTVPLLLKNKNKQDMNISLGVNHNHKKRKHNNESTEDSPPAKKQKN
eukprot:108077_1